MIGRLGSSAWMGDENELDSSAGSHSRLVPRHALSTCRAGRCCRRMLSLGCSWLLVRLLLRSVLLAPCILCGRFPLVPSSCLLAIRSARFALSSYRSAPRSFDKWGGANTGCVSVWVRLGRCCLLLAVAGSWMWRVGVSLVGLARCRRVDGVGCLRDFCRPRCLLRPRYHRGSSWADRRRALASWLRFVVGCRGSSSFRLACPLVSSSSVVFAPWGFIRC